MTIYSRDEHKHWRLQRRHPDVHFIIGDILDRDRLASAMVGHDAVIHAGALKFIPEAERNVWEAHRVNVVGSIQVAASAAAAGVRSVVGISTDKAARPETTYGITKLLMERLFGEANRWSDTRFVTVRYGNVVGSTGSVIPAFMEQLAAGGPMTITDPLMTRFWLPPSQAVALIRWALDEAPEYPGCTFVQRCAAMRLSSLAEAVYRHWMMGEGWQDPGEGCDTPVEVIGRRVNEKTHELLIDQDEAQRTKETRQGFILHPPTSDYSRPFEDSMLELSSASAVKLDSSTMLEWIAEAERL